MNIKTIKCDDPCAKRQIWNGKIIVDGGSIEGIINNDVNITYINGQFLKNGIMVSLLKKNCNDEVYNMEKIDSKDGIDYFEGTCTNSLDSQYKRIITLEDDNMLVDAKVKGLKKQIQDYKKSLFIGK